MTNEKKAPRKSKVGRMVSFGYRSLQYVPDVGDAEHVPRRVCLVLPGPGPVGGRVRTGHGHAWSVACYSESGVFREPGEKVSLRTSGMVPPTAAFYDEVHDAEIVDANRAALIEALRAGRPVDSVPCQAHRMLRLDAEVDGERFVCVECNLHVSAEGLEATGEPWVMADAPHVVHTAEREKYGLVSVDGKAYAKGLEPKAPPADGPLGPWTTERACKVLERAIRAGRPVDNFVDLAAEYVTAGAEPFAARAAAQVYFAHTDPERGCGQAMADALNGKATRAGVVATPAAGETPEAKAAFEAWRNTPIPLKRRPTPVARVLAWLTPNVVRVQRELGARPGSKRLCFAFGARDPQARMRRWLDGSPVVVVCQTKKTFASYDELYLVGVMPEEADARPGDYVWDADDVLGRAEPAFDLALACESPHPNGTAPSAYGSGRSISVAKRFVGTEARVTIGTGGAELRVERFELEPTRPSYEALIDDALKACEASAMAADVVRRFPAPPLPGGLRYAPPGSGCTYGSRSWAAWAEWAEHPAMRADPYLALRIARLCGAFRMGPTTSLEAVVAAARNDLAAEAHRMAALDRHFAAAMADQDARVAAFDEVVKAKGGAT